MNKNTIMVNKLNTIAHILFANILLQHYPGDITIVQSLLVSFSSVAVDLDHIPKLDNLRRNKRFGPGSRSLWHELPGLLVTSLISFIIMLISEAMGRMLLIGFVSHYFLDMLTRPTRPFYPLTDTTIFLKLAPRKLSNVMLYDLIITFILGLVFYWNPSV